MRTYAHFQLSGLAQGQWNVVKLVMRANQRAMAERVKAHQFERLVARTLDRLPDYIVSMLDNVEVVIEDEPRGDHLADADSRNGASLFGLYQGIPLTRRGSGYTMVLPDKITIFRRPIERAYPATEDMAEQIRVTVIHELAHHVGIDEARLDELGWG